MALGDRTKQGLEGWFNRRPSAGQPTWGERLAGWGAGLLAKGMTDLLEGAEPQTKELMRGTLLKMLESPGITPELRQAIEASIERGDWVATVFGYIGMIVGSIVGILHVGEPPGRVQAYAVDRIAQSFRLDPISIITAWRRDPETYAGLFEDLKDQGWDDQRIEALKFLTMYYPPPADLIRWQAREVFEPGMIEKYGLDDEFGGIEKEPFYKAGMSDEQILNYWRAHWEHASWIQIVEMLRRNLIDETDVWDWFRLVEIVPYWRDKLIAMSWEVPTRVDIRRFWDMGTIDEERLRELYTAQGYHGKDLDDYVLWTKVYVAFPDLVARYKNGWLTLDQVKDELVRLGMSADRAQELLETKFKAAEEERTAAEKTKTRSDILKGVKEGVITRDQAVELLQDLNYSEDEAVFILEVNIPVDEQDETVALRQLTKSDILKALKTEVIDEDQARERLLELRYSPADAELLLDIYKASLEEITDEDYRELTKADIIKGVKKGLLTQEEAYLVLQGIGYRPEDAAFILDIETEESPFSPRSYEEFKDRTSQWRQAVRADNVPGDDELRAAASELVKVKNEVKILEAGVEEERRGLVEGEELPESATARLKGMEVALNRARAELERVQQHYNVLMARKKYTAE